MHESPEIAGAGDQAAGALGVGVTGPGPLSVVLGTSGVVFGAARAVRGRRRGARARLLPRGARHVARDGRDALGGGLAAVAARRGRARTTPFDALVAEAAAWPPGCEGLLFAPYLAGERTPHADPDARGAFVGLSLRHDRGALVRAVLEGVAYGLRDSLELLRAARRRRRSVGRVSGGGARSALWREIVASVLDLPLETVAVEEGAAYGAALLAGCRDGTFADPREAAERVRARRPGGPIRSRRGSRRTPRATSASAALPRAAHAVRLGVEAALVDGALVPGDVEIADGRIARVGARRAPAAGIAVPGFVDLHVHGFAGVDFAAADAAAYRRAGEAMLATGVTAFQPTFVTAPEDELVAALREVPRATTSARAILGVPPRGPVPLAARASACIRRAARRDPDVALLRAAARRRTGRAHDARAGARRARSTSSTLLAPAASSPRAATRTRPRTRRAAAFDRGATHVTHLFNAMRPFTHRDPGIAGAALVRDDVTVELILDGHHVADEAALLAVATRPRGRVALVTDGMAAAGAGDGTWQHRPGRASTCATASCARSTASSRAACSRCATRSATRCGSASRSRRRSTRRRACPARAARRTDVGTHRGRAHAPTSSSLDGRPRRAARARRRRRARLAGPVERRRGVRSPS